MKNVIQKTAITTLVVGLVACLSSSDVQAQPKAHQLDGSVSSTPFAGASAKTSSLLSRRNIQRDLELTSEQVEKLRELRKNGDSAIQQMMKDFRDRAREMDPDERREFYRKLADERKKNAEELDDKINDILMPFQTKRLKQIKIQYQIQHMSRNSASPILHPAIKDELGIDEEQEASIKKKIAEVEAQLKKDIAELRKKAADEVFDELSKDQQKAFEELVGEKLEGDANLRGPSPQDLKKK